MPCSLKRIIPLICLGLITLLLTPSRAHAAATLTVNTNADGPFIDDDNCTLREALDVANNNSDAGREDACLTSGTLDPTNPADVIEFDADYTITLDSTEEQLNITDALTINGTGRGRTIIQASTCEPNTTPGGCTPADFRVFNIDSPGLTVTVNDVTIQHGNAELTGGLTDNIGGAIHVQAGSLNLADSLISFNRVTGGGGGIALTGTASATINDSEVSDNGAFRGGGLAALDDSRIDIVNTDILRNETLGGRGGGLLVAPGAAALVSAGSLISMNNATLPSTGGGGGIESQGTLTVSDSTISLNSVFNSGSGGGIQSGGTLNVSNTIISGNTVENGRGGGIDSSGQSTLSNTIISDNEAATNGGGLHNRNARVEINNSSFTGNTAGDTGGAIYNDIRGGGTFAELTITGGSISRNTASADAGGIFNTLNAQLTLDSVTLEQNSAPARGGAIGNGGTALIQRSTLSGNSAGDGGAIYNLMADLTLGNSTLFGNTASGNGGGLVNDTSGAQAELENVTIFGNSASSGGGIYNVNGAQLTLTNSLIGGSSGTDYADGGTGLLTLQGNNLVQDGSIAAALMGDPLLGGLANNGGPTRTMLPQESSPAVNSGLSGSVTSSTDQRGAARIIGTNVDLGAVEREAIPLETSLSCTGRDLLVIIAAGTPNFDISLTTPDGSTPTVTLTSVGTQVISTTMFGTFSNITLVDGNMITYSFEDVTCSQQQDDSEAEDPTPTPMLIPATATVTPPIPTPTVNQVTATPIIPTGQTPLSPGSASNSEDDEADSSQSSAGASPVEIDTPLTPEAVTATPTLAPILPAAQECVFAAYETQSDDWRRLFERSHQSSNFIPTNRVNREVLECPTPPNGVVCFPPTDTLLARAEGDIQNIMLVDISGQETLTFAAPGQVIDNEVCVNFDQEAQGAICEACALAPIVEPGAERNLATTALRCAPLLLILALVIWLMIALSTRRQREEEETVDEPDFVDS